MKDMANKAGIFLLCSYFFIINNGISLSSITIMLAVLTISCLCSYTDQTAFSVCLQVGFCVTTLLLHCAGLYLPVLVYDAIRGDRKFTLPPVILGVCYTCMSLRLFTFPYLVFFLLTAALSLYCRHMDQLYLELHRIRDENKERTLMLRQRNQALIEKQNADIHAATLSERNRIAREIHDNVGHMLTRSILQVGALKVINENPSLDKPIGDLQETLNTAMTSVRSSVHDLHDDAIDLASAIREITDAIKSPAISLDYDMGDHVPKEIKYAFIAIVKEATNNMQKHSNATSAEIQMREHPGFFLLHIADNGTKKNLHPTNGIGLSNMEERVRNLGGTIRFDTENGFKISIMIKRR